MKGPIRSDRRQALARLAALVGGAALARVLGLTGCARGPSDPPGTVRVPLASLRDGERKVVFVGGTPVELMRGETISARSLQCTHWGCKVRWDEAARRYKCPCHHGEYDADGNVVVGPPPKPLPRWPVEVTADTVILRPLVAAR